MAEKQKFTVLDDFIGPERPERLPRKFSTVDEALHEAAKNALAIYLENNPIPLNTDEIIDEWDDENAYEEAI